MFVIFANSESRDLETQLLNLGYKLVSLRSKDSQEERVRKIDAFNNDPKVQILLFNTKLGAQSLNLHTGGSRIAIIEPPPNMATAVQVIGRISRVGQTSDQLVLLLWVDETYDQILLHKLCRKFISTYGGEGAIERDKNGDADAATIVEEGEAVFSELWGLEHSPYAFEWGDPRWDSKKEWLAKLAKGKRNNDEPDEDDMLTPDRNTERPLVAALRNSHKKATGGNRHTKIRASQYGANKITGGESKDADEDEDAEVAGRYFVIYVIPSANLPC